MNKRLGLLLLILGVLVILSGCNLKKKITENITEGILEQAFGEGTDIDISDGELKFTNKDGEEIVFDDENGLVIEGEDGSILASGGVYEWPKDKAALYIPKLDEGKITYLLNTPESCLLYLEELSEEAYFDYQKEIVNQGYIENKYEATTEAGYIYGASNKEGIAVTLMYDINSVYLQITVDASQKK